MCVFFCICVCDDCVDVLLCVCVVNVFLCVFVCFGC